LVETWARWHDNVDAAARSPLVLALAPALGRVMTRLAELPPLLPCPCGSTRRPQVRRRGTATHLSAVQCYACKRRSIAAGDPFKIYENWNDMVRTLLRAEAFRS
jgi:hypothetical protein